MKPWVVVASLRRGLERERILSIAPTERGVGLEVFDGRMGTRTEYSMP